MIFRENETVRPMTPAKVSNDCSSENECDHSNKKQTRANQLKIEAQISAIPYYSYAQSVAPIHPTHPSPPHAFQAPPPFPLPHPLRQKWKKTAKRRKETQNNKKNGGAF